jgi:NIPSNAP
MSRWSLVGVVAVAFVGGMLAREAMPIALQAQTSPAQSTQARAGRVFEIRTYTAPDGKLGDLHARFRNHTLRIFAKHGMTNVVYFAPREGALAQNTLVYVLAHESREAATRSWAAFRADPEWQKVAADSQVNGPIVSKVESIFADATDYSPLK